MSAPRQPDSADHKRRLIAESSRARARLARALSPIARLEASAQRLAESGRHLIRQPATLGALALLLAVLGPRRVFRSLRWVTLALPLNPVGRQLLSVVGTKLMTWLSATRR